MSTVFIMGWTSAAGSDRVCQPSRVASINFLIPIVGIIVLKGPVVGVLVYHSFMPKFAANEAIKGASIAFICVFVAGFALSWGALGWLVPAGERPFFFRVGFRWRPVVRRPLYNSDPRDQ